VQHAESVAQIIAVFFATKARSEDSMPVPMPIVFDRYHFHNQLSAVEQFGPRFSTDLGENRGEITRRTAKAT
jgi:hypothetical protein